MYAVSDAFLTAIKKNTRRYYWMGKITTTGGAVYEFAQSDIVKGGGHLLPVLREHGDRAWYGLCR